MFNEQIQQPVDRTDLHAYNNLSGKFLKPNINITGT
jgi:hypothetical protein